MEIEVACRMTKCIYRTCNLHHWGDLSRGRRGRSAGGYTFQLLASRASSIHLNLLSLLYVTMLSMRA